MVARPVSTGVSDKAAAGEKESRGFATTTAAVANDQPASSPKGANVVVVNTERPTPNLGSAGVVAPPASAPAALLDLAAMDPSLHLATLGKSAHLTLDAGGAGELMLHLRVRDGVTDVRVDGGAAGAVNMRAEDVRTALAGEGLVLGHFETVVQPDPTGANAGPTNALPFNGGAQAPTGLPDRAGPEPSWGSNPMQMGSQSESQSSFGSPSRDGRGRWDQDDRAADVVPAATPRSGTPADAGNEPRRRRGLHVKA